MSSVPELSYHGGFLSSREAGSLFQHMLDEVPWQREVLHLYGRVLPVPRLLAWCGDAGVNYRYSGADHPCGGWLDALRPVRDRLQTEFGLPCNVVLLNRYRSGADHMGWHRDDEPGLGVRLASLSLGASRRFLVQLPGERTSRRLRLEPGSLLLMDGRLRHRLPPTRQPVGERINLTFRHVARAP